MRYGYYPGCSLTRSAEPYDDSTKAIAGPLGLEFDEVDDWNCCGATEYIALNKSAAYALVARNLALAADEGHTELVAPCSACYLNLRKADAYMGKHPELAESTNEALQAGGLHYEADSLRVRHLLDVLWEDVGPEEIQGKVTRPLTGLKLAPYYGCLIVRPELNGGQHDPEHPSHMDRMLETLGANVLDFPMKTRCCGGHMTQISAPTAAEILRQILQNAEDYEADALVTICPMCQLNLDAYQGLVNRHFGTKFHIPVLYITQVIGLAMDIPPGELGIGREVVSAREALRKIGTELPAEEAPARRPKDDPSLPMPRVGTEARS
ncbi:MAG: CoB--CoM heterodisulfide reductase iron-sulfur subunit B family protein [bacterium]